MLTRNSNLFQAIITGIVGVILIILNGRVELLDWVSIAIGLMFILPSLYVLCSSIGSKRPLPAGIAFVSVGGIILGLLMCVFPSAFAGFFVYVFAALLVIFGIYHIVDLANWSKSISIPFAFFIIPILMIAAGIVILCTSLHDINSVVVLITGIGLAASSVNSICEYVRTGKVARRAVTSGDND